MGQQSNILQIDQSEWPDPASVPEGTINPRPPNEKDAWGAHCLQFYEDDSVLLDHLADFLTTALADGACLVIATASHASGLSKRLWDRRIDVAGVVQNQRLILLDAKKTLARFMINGSPRRDLFFRVIESEVQRAKQALGPASGKIAAFGEIVAVLWDEGNYEAAIELEELWNELIPLHGIVLRCAYPMRAFAGENRQELFHQVCGQHSHVIPSETHISIEDESGRLRMISSLEQKANIVKWAVKERDHEAQLRRQAETRMRRSEELARRVLESGRDCVKVIDLQGRLEYINPAGLVAMEIQDGNRALGRSWIDWWREEDRSRVEAALSKASQGGSGGFQADCLTDSGTVRSWDVRITAIGAADGQVRHLLAVCRDITELRQAQQAVLQAERLAAAGRLAATIAHEINNPLEAVTNLIYLARLTPGLSPEVSDRLDAADRQLAEVAQIARRTLRFYRDHAQSCRFLVADCVRDVLSVYEHRLRNTQIQLAVSIDPELRIFGKPGELRQVLANLIANAIDATNRGGVIRIRARSAAISVDRRDRRESVTDGKTPAYDGVRITLADNGCGMSPEVKRRLFTPFFSTKPQTGNGIGLWVTKSLIEQQGGSLQVRSRQGKKPGTVITIFIPTPVGQD